MPRNYETTLLVPDLDDSVGFYHEVMDLPIRERIGSRVVFDTGECALVLEGGLSEATLDAYGLAPLGKNSGNGVLISIMYDTITPVYERIQAHDEAKALIEPRDSSWGERLFLVKDPDGYVLDVAELL